jgi:hypothetical protein
MGEGASGPATKATSYGSRPGRRPAKDSQSRFHRTDDEAAFYFERYRMTEALDPTEISFDAYTMCSFLPDLDSTRAVPLVLIGYRQNQDPWFVWLVPKEGLSSEGLTGDPYYAKVLSDPHEYFTRKLDKYVASTGCVKRGIEMLIDCHQNHLAFTPLTVLKEIPFRHPLQVELVGAF